MGASTFRLRRQLSLAVTIVALSMVTLIVWIQQSRLAHTSLFTGFLLLGSVFFLVLLGVRRRLPTLALGSVSNWTQIHIYAGLFSVGVYVLHVPALVGNGIFESGLSMLFLLVAASGFYGLFASRTIPKKLTAIDGQTRFDQFHWHRAQIRDKAAGLVGELSEHTSAGVIGSLYASQLGPYFASSPSLSYLIFPTGRRRRALLAGLKEIDRYIEAEGRTSAGRFAALVRYRDDVDYQYALQLRLRLWIVFHSLLSIALIACGIVHATVAWRFVG